MGMRILILTDATPVTTARVTDPLKLMAGGKGERTLQFNPSLDSNLISSEVITLQSPFFRVMSFY